MIKPCNCGSGKLRFELRDAAGIFCRFVCNDCYDRVKASYNPAIFESAKYAAHGTEEALEAADYDDEDVDYDDPVEPDSDPDPSWHGGAHDMIR